MDLICFDEKFKQLVNGICITVPLSAVPHNRERGEAVWRMEESYHKSETSSAVTLPDLSNINIQARTFVNTVKSRLAFF